MNIGVLFPGQGSQFVGMGADLFDARPDLLGERADAILGFSLRSLCLDGPEEELTRTQNAQPALFALSYALWDQLETETGITPAGAAGHSLGEYTALTAAGVFDFDTALGLVARRGAAMGEAAELEPSGMAALIGTDEAVATQVCEAREKLGGRLEVANINAPGQVVVAGGVEDVEWLTKYGRDHGVRRAIPLKVAGAFHSRFMAPAAESVSTALRDVAVHAPTFPVWANTTARPHVEAEIPSVLARQVSEPVRFAESLRNMISAGIDHFVHVGPGDVTAGLARKTVPEVEVVVVSKLDDIPTAAAMTGTIGRR